MRDQPEAEIRKQIAKDYKHLDSAIYAAPLDIAIQALKD
jgi:hypothetical protein